jgi:hypothetical protein
MSYFTYSCTTFVSFRAHKIFVSSNPFSCLVSLPLPLVFVHLIATRYYTTARALTELNLEDSVHPGCPPNCKTILNLRICVIY